MSAGYPPFLVARKKKVRLRDCSWAFHQQCSPLGRAKVIKTREEGQQPKEEVKEKEKGASGRVR